MKYCCICTITISDIDIKKNTINTPMRTNVFQCPSCLAISEPLANVIDYDKPCHKCNKNDIAKRYIMECGHWVCKDCCQLVKDNDAYVYKCDICSTLGGSSISIIHNKRLNVPNKFILNYKKLYVHLFDIIDSYIDTKNFCDKHKILITALEEYHKWLKLLIKYGGPHILSPSKIIDKIWHTHILDTENYVDTCKKLCGKFIHHYPENSFIGQKDERENRRNNTLMFYREKYGLMSPDVGKIWSITPSVIEFYKSKTTDIIHIKQITGKIVDLPFVDSMTIRNIKEMINEIDGSCIDQLKLIHAGKFLADNEELKSYKIFPNVTLYVVLNIKGC